MIPDKTLFIYKQVNGEEIDSPIMNTKSPIYWSRTKKGRDGYNSLNLLPNHALDYNGLILPIESVNDKVREKVKRHVIDRLLVNAKSSYLVEEGTITRTSSMPIYQRKFESLINEEVERNNISFHEALSVFFKFDLIEKDLFCSFYVPENYQELAKEKIAYLGKDLNEISLDTFPEEFFWTGGSISARLDGFAGTGNLNECLVKAYEIKSA
jgi:hypothetical protein